MERITIVGMGPVGTSMGLALKQKALQNTEIVGTAGDRGTLSKIGQMGAVDRTESNLRAAVEDAGIVVLDLGIIETREILEAIGPVMDEGSIITDTCTTKACVQDWADQYVGRGVTFVGGHPLLKKTPADVDGADPSLFEGSHYCVVSANSADRKSVETIVGFVELLGAKPLFMTAEEHDSFAAAMQHLPAILSSAFVTATSRSDGWRDMHRLAGSEFADLSQLASNDPRDNEASSLSNPDALVHWVDQMIAELYSYRNQINERSDELFTSFVKAWEARARWESDAVSDDDLPMVPTFGQNMGSFLLGDRLARRFREMTEGDRQKKRKWTYPGNR